MREIRILAFVITYYPDISLLRRNLDTFSEHVDHIVIWDNTPTGDKDVSCIAKEYERTTYLSESENKGISYALNKAWYAAKTGGFDYLLTMDQDSIWQDFKQFISIALSTESPQGIYGPEVRERKTSPKTIEVVDYVITSGMLVPITILDHVGGYREDFFVDGIDLEFCLRAKTLGVKTYRLTSCHMRQRFGNPQTTVFLGHHHTSNYPPQRIKEMLKTHIILLRHYSCSFSLRKKIVMTYFLKLPLKLLFLENNKRTKFKGFFQGIWEGLHGSSR